MSIFLTYDQEVRRSSLKWINFITVFEVVAYGVMTWELGILYFSGTIVVTYMVSKETNILFKIADDLGQRAACIDAYNRALLAIYLRLGVLGFSLIVGFASIIVAGDLMAIKNNPAVIAASQQVQMAQDNLETGRASLLYTKLEYLAAQGEAASIKTEIEVEHMQLVEELQDKLSAWKGQLAFFWAANNLHAKNLSNADVMDENWLRQAKQTLSQSSFSVLSDCLPKKVRNGYLRTAAKKACIILNGLVAKKPVVNDSDVIKQLRKKVTATTFNYIRI